MPHAAMRSQGTCVLHERELSMSMCAVTCSENLPARFCGNLLEGCLQGRGQVQPCSLCPGSSRRNSRGGSMEHFCLLKSRQAALQQPSPAFACCTTVTTRENCGLLHHLHPDHRELLEEHRLREAEALLRPGGLGPASCLFLNLLSWRCHYRRPPSAFCNRARRGARGAHRCCAPRCALRFPHERF